MNKGIEPLSAYIFLCVYFSTINNGIHVILHDALLKFILLGKECNLVVFFLQLCEK
jgi:hypothetical protein